MTNRIRVERALTLSDPGVGWVVIASGFGAYFAEWSEALAYAFKLADRRREPAHTGIACRANVHELCSTTWCECGCHA
jgi:hypothetical protein